MELKQVFYKANAVLSPNKQCQITEEYVLISVTPSVTNKPNV